MMLAAVAIAACTDNKFHVEGQITNAGDSVLYFENVGLEGVQVLDSAKLGSDGSFGFSGEAPEAPEFYRLRIASQIINVSIDSTETVQVRVSIPAWQPTIRSVVPTTVRRSVSWPSVRWICSVRPSTCRITLTSVLPKPTIAS